MSSRTRCGGAVSAESDDGTTAQLGLGRPRRGTIPLIRIAGASLIAALALTGCAAGPNDAGSEGEPVVEAISTVDSADDITLPLDAYSFTEREDRTISRAYLLLVKRCGERFGVTVTMPPPENPSPVYLAARRYFIIDPNEAAQYGYNRPPSGSEEDDKAGGWNPSDRELAVLGRRTSGAEELRDRSGAALPDGGCLGEAGRALGVPPVGADDIVRRLASDAYDRAETDSRVVAAFTAWSRCMKRSGYSYETPWEPNNLDWPEPAQSAEIATAKADVACKRETNLAGVMMAVEAAYQHRQIEQRSQELSHIQAWRDDRVRRAAQALAAS